MATSTTPVVRARLALAAFVAVLGLAFGYGTGQTPSTDPDGEQAVRQAVEQYRAAMNSADADAAMSVWAADAEYTDDGGRVVKARTALADLFKDHSAELKGWTFDYQVTNFRLVGAGAALLEGTVVLMSPDGQSESCRYAAALSKTGGKWLINNARDLPAEDDGGEAAAAQLRHLDWLVGDWCHEDAGCVASLSCRWAKNGTFLVQDYVAIPKSGDELAVTNWIGWDPVAGQLRSWFFDSNGGHGDGLWSETGQTWSVAVSGVLADGRSASSVNRWERDGSNTALWHAAERCVDGQPMADARLTFVRKPADPKAPPPQTVGRPAGAYAQRPRPVNPQPPTSVRPGFVPSYRPPTVYHPPVTTSVRPAGPRPVVTPSYRPGTIAGSPSGVYAGHRYATQPAYAWGTRTGIAVWPTYRPLYAYHGAWHHGYWYFRPYHPAVWIGGGVALGWLLAPGETFVYYNPYYVPTYAPIYDYLQPLPVPVPVPSLGQPAPAPGSQAAPADVQRDFDAARMAFRQGDYQNALKLVDGAITRLPGDAELHQFRGLCLFAMGNYRDAAATLYAVLAAGPGWNWETLKACYPNVSTYTAQLRALESYQRSHSAAPEASFVLAYHYLALGYPDQAGKQLEHVVALRPDDKLSAQLLQMLTQARADQPVPQP